MESSRGTGDGSRRLSSSTYPTQFTSPRYFEGRAQLPTHQPPIPFPYPPDPFSGADPFCGEGNRRMSVGSFSARQNIALEHPVMNPFFGARGHAPIVDTSFSPSPHNPSSQMSGIGSPLASDASNLVRQPSIGDTPSHLKVPMRVPEVVKPLDRVAQPSEMPIGSLAHLQSPPTWGVVKVSNVSNQTSNGFPFKYSPQLTFFWV